jgi:mannose-6-phosphate isomerase-like protein (cupin superfamily)
MSQPRAVANPVPPGEGTAYWFTTDLYIVKLQREDTDGAFTLVELTAAPQSPLLPHMHHKEDEIYYVLDGEFEFMDDNRTFTAGAGSVVCLRKDRFHYHRNPGDRPARALVLYQPGGIEQFVAEAGKPAGDASSLPPSFDEEDVERLVAAAPKHGFEAPPEPA